VEGRVKGRTVWVSWALRPPALDIELARAPPVTANGPAAKCDGFIRKERATCIVVHTYGKLDKPMSLEPPRRLRPVIPRQQDTGG
jgi:hypothetical protein